MNVQGNTQGLKHNQLRRIEKLFTRRIAPHQIVTPEFARAMTELSHETRRQIGVLIDRKGYVEYVVVGDARSIMLPDFKRVRTSVERFRGLRCVHTHLRGEQLTQDDLTDLALLRLDLMAAITVDEKTGLPNLIHTAHLLPSTAEALDSNGHLLPFVFLDSVHPAQLDVDFLELMQSLEEEMTRNRRVARKAGVRDRAILVGVPTGALTDAEESMAELEELALSADVVVLDKIIQRRADIDPRTLLGKGKLQDILIRSMQLGVDVIIFDRELSPAQVRAISEATDLKVIDRSQLILDIFAQRAQSREGKIQVELAQLKYMLPRLIQGHDSAFSRLAGGIGGRGPGETKLETDRRRVRDRISRLEKEIESFRGRRKERRKERLRKDFPIISLVGYTNAGKSTLLNTLTNSNVHAEQRMFATLDPTSRRLRLPREQEVIINDTVGFIRDLPPDLIAAFRATLEEISDSDLLIHVIDASNPRLQQQTESVERILNDLDLSHISRMIVFNKADLIDEETIAALLRQASNEDAVAVSALQSKTLTPMLEKVGALLAKNLTKFEEHSYSPETSMDNADVLAF
jgi:GTP-binding protein HflX